jgi:hypothetical protein
VQRNAQKLLCREAACPSNLKAILRKGLNLRDRYLERAVSDCGLASATDRVESDMARLLDTNYRSDQNRRLAKHLNHEFEHLFTYLKCPGLDATYRGEHAIRPARGEFPAMNTPNENRSRS